MNFFLVTYDLYTPGQKYENLITEIKTSPLWAKVMLSCFIVGTSESASQLYQRLKSKLDQNDYILVIRACKPYDGWFQKDIHDWIQSNVPTCY